MINANRSSLFKTSFSQVDMAHFCPLPLSLTVGHKRRQEVFISDIRMGAEEGKVWAVWQFCPENYSRDLYIPPNYNFRQCFLHNQTTALVPSGASVKKLLSEDGESFFSGVLLGHGAMVHLMSRHSISSGSSKKFISDRQKPFFLRDQPFGGGPGNSVFIDSTMVKALIKATLLHPDKITHSVGSKIFYERGFRTEIGHNYHGCCHVVRVITEITASHEKSQLKVVTAYPVSHFWST